MFSLASNLPLIVMTSLQIHYATLVIFTRVALLDRLSTMAFVVYRLGITLLAYSHPLSLIFLLTRFLSLLKFKKFRKVTT